MVYLSDVNGVRRDKNDPESLINSLTAEQARELMSDGTIESGMIPKVQACLDILDCGVRKVHIIDGRVRHALLLEVFTSKGVGTEIIKTVGGTGSAAKRQAHQARAGGPARPAAGAPARLSHPTATKRRKQCPPRLPQPN